MNDRDDRSAPSLIGDLVTHVTELFRKEIQLLRAEINEKTTQAAAAVGMIVAGVIFALTALNVLAAALVVAIENLGVPAGWAAVIVGVIFAVIALILASRGMNNLKASSLAPDRTARAASRDAALVREKV
jgi:TRAP-type C4-dicarboxylate transport system permease small subunit